MGPAINTERAAIGRVETKRLADDWIEIRLFDADDQLEAIMELRPTYHDRYAAALLIAQAEIRETESQSSPRSVIPFPIRAVQVLALLPFLVA